jgi:hypothetical protein
MPLISSARVVTIVGTRGGGRGAPDGEGDPGERHLLLRDVLKLTRNHPPPLPILEHEEPAAPDHCLFARQRNIQPYRFVDSPSWVSYAEARDLFRQAREQGSTSHVAPFAHDAVFAPLKVVLADRDRPLRAVLAAEPVYPARGWLGTLLPGEHPWLAHAAVAVLNSGLGQQYYDHLRGIPSGETGADLEKELLEQLPVARRDFAEPELRQVAHLCRQLHLLYQAEAACRRSFLPQVHRTEARLRTAVERLLGLREVEVVRGRRHRVTSAPEQLALDLGVEVEDPAPAPIRLLESGEEVDAETRELVASWEAEINAPLPETAQPTA